MTLEEAIWREETLAYSFGERYKQLGEPVGDLMELEQEHKQMAEWLKELKKLRTEHKGKWINNNNDDAGEGFFICSNCENDVYDATDYCPNCGADMRESEDSKWR